MGKTVEEICNLLIKNYAITPVNYISAPIKHAHKTLTSCVCCTNIEKYNPYQALFNDENLYNTLERKITTELATAVDQNNVRKVKYLKNKYGDLKEYKNAREFLNKKCKEVWNVYETINKLPKDAMKCLGITNLPDLDLILGESLKNYGNNESDTTSYIISSILKNKNLSYSINDIHKYLKEKCKRENIKYNTKTVQYLITEHNYNDDKLKDLGVDKQIVKQALKNLPIKYKIKFFRLLAI